MTGLKGSHYITVGGSNLAGSPLLCLSDFHSIAGDADRARQALPPPGAARAGDERTEMSLRQQELRLSFGRESVGESAEKFVLRESETGRLSLPTGTPVSNTC